MTDAIALHVALQRNTAVPAAERIVQAAYEVFLEVGFAKATTGLIAARAKVSKRAIYTCFLDKDALFAAVVLNKRHLILDLPAQNDGPTRFIDRIAQAFRLRITEAESRERGALLDLINREASMSPALMHYLYENRIIRTRELLMDWLEAERAAGHVRFADTQVVATLLMDVIFGALQPRRRANQPIARQALTTHLLRCVEIILHGLEAASDHEHPASLPRATRRRG